MTEDAEGLVEVDVASLVEPVTLEAVDPEAPEVEALEMELLWTSDESLTIDEARRLTGERGATLVLFAGETAVGKTTAIVEIWTSLLLTGRIGSSSLRGSNNALAFERRAFDSRVESLQSTTLRTDVDTEGFLHLGLGTVRGPVELLFADFAGEHFRSMVEGTEASDELEWFGRVDRLAVFIDGALVANPSRAQVAVTRTRRMLWKFRDAEVRNPLMRVALVLTKAELVNENRLAEFREHLDGLHALAMELDPDAAMLRVSARPADGTDPSGLEELTDWIVGQDRVNTVYGSELTRPSRAFGRLS